MVKHLVLVEAEALKLKKNALRGCIHGNLERCREWFDNIFELLLFWSGNFN